MAKMRGSISLVCLIIVLILLGIVQVMLHWSMQENRRACDYLRNVQLRILCGSVFNGKRDELLPYGEKQCYKGLLQPNDDIVTVTCKSSYSSDELINFLEVSAAAANHVGAVQRLRRINVRFPQEQQRIASEYALASCILEGQEYLAEKTIYTSLEEVKLPQIDFLKKKCPSTLTVKSVEEEGFNARFYFLEDNNTILQLGSSKPAKGDTLIASQRDVNISANSVFPNRLVLIGSKSIIIGENVKLENVVIMAKDTVRINSGCQINGFITAKRIVLTGVSEFSRNIDALQPISTPAYSTP